MLRTERNTQTPNPSRVCHFCFVKKVIQVGKVEASSRFSTGNSNDVWTTEALTICLTTVTIYCSTEVTVTWAASIRMELTESPIAILYVTHKDYLVGIIIISSNLWTDIIQMGDYDYNHNEAPNNAIHNDTIQRSTDTIQLSIDTIHYNLYWYNTTANWLNTI